VQEARRARSQSSTTAGQMERGMASFAKQTIGMYRSGFDSRRMLLQVRHLALCQNQTVYLQITGSTNMPRVFDYRAPMTEASGSLAFAAEIFRR